MTLDTDFVENLIALTLADWNTVAQFQLADWLDTGLSRSFGCFGNIAERTASRQFDQEVNHCNDNNDTAHKGEQCRALGFVVAELFHLVGLAVRLGCAVSYSLCVKRS